VHPSLARLRPALAAALFVAAGCATRWAPSETRSEPPLQWPPAPAPAKLRFERALGGFAPLPGARALVRAAVYGRGAAAERAFVLPVAVAVAADGRIAVADLGRAAVHLFEPGGGRYLRLGGTRERPFVAPVGLAFDPGGQLFVADSTGALYGFAPDGAPRFATTAAGPERLLRPTGLAHSAPRGLVYLADTLAGRVHAFDSTGEWRFAFGRRGGGAGELNFPTHLAVAGERLYVSDSLNFRVAIFDPGGAPLGSFGRHGDGTGDLALPKGIAAGGDGVVYLGDSLFDAVQLFRADGAYLLTLGRRGTALGEFWLPSGLFLAGDGRLFVCDTYNRRVQVFRVVERDAPPGG
jgi:sugar lactone lactonase YvrE